MLPWKKKLTLILYRHQNITKYIRSEKHFKSFLRFCCEIFPVYCVLPVYFHEFISFSKIWGRPHAYDRRDQYKNIFSSTKIPPTCSLCRTDAAPLLCTWPKQCGQIFRSRSQERDKAIRERFRAQLKLTETWKTDDPCKALLYTSNLIQSSKDKIITACLRPSPSLNYLYTLPPHPLDPPNWTGTPSWGGESNHCCGNRKSYVYTPGNISGQSHAIFLIY